MQCLQDGKIPELKTGSRTEENEQAVYLDELKNLTKQNHEKFHNLSKLMDKAYIANDAEREWKKLSLNTSKNKSRPMVHLWTESTGSNKSTKY